jgi:hypothetical protein
VVYVSEQFNGFILLRGGKAYFKRGIFGATEVGRLRVDGEAIMEFAKNSNSLSKVKVTRSGVRVYDETLYKQLLVYSVTLSSMRKRSLHRILRLMERVSKLDDYSLHFWYAEAISKFKEGGLIALKSVSRALRALYGIDK